MVKVIGQDKRFYLDKKTVEELDIALEAMIDYEQDLILIIDGKEGSGKSQFSRQIGYYCSAYLKGGFTKKKEGNATVLHPKNPDKCMDLDKADHIHNELYDYLHSSLNGGKFQINILDESRKGLNKKASMTRAVRHFTDYLSECRDQQQVHILLLPAFHDLEEYVVNWRMNFLIHMVKKYNKDKKGKHKLQLGEYKLFANDKYLKECYKNKYKYPKKYEARDTNSNVEVLSSKGLKAYKEKKAKKRKDKYDKREEEAQKYQIIKERVMVINNLRRKHNMTMEEIAECFGVHRVTLYEWIDREKDTRPIVKV